MLWKNGHLQADYEVTTVHKVQGWGYGDERNLTSWSKVGVCLSKPSLRGEGGAGRCEAAGSKQPEAWFSQPPTPSCQGSSYPSGLR